MLPELPHADYGKAALFLHFYGISGTHNLLLSLDDSMVAVEVERGVWRFPDGSTLTIPELPVFLTRQAD